MNYKTLASLTMGVLAVAYWAGFIMGQNNMADRVNSAPPDTIVHSDTVFRTIERVRFVNIPARIETVLVQSEEVYFARMDTVLDQRDTLGVEYNLTWQSFNLDWKPGPLPVVYRQMDIFKTVVQPVSFWRGIYGRIELGGDWSEPIIGIPDKYLEAAFGVTIQGRSWELDIEPLGFYLDHDGHEYRYSINTRVYPW